MVQVGFVQAMHTVMESDGQVFVCINISGAVLDRSVTVFVSTTNDTASREPLLCLNDQFSLCIRWPEGFII